MFYSDRQEQFPEEFRIDSSDWDYNSILDYINQDPEEDESLDPNDFKDIILRIWRVNNKAESSSSNDKLRRVENMIMDNDDFDEAEINYMIKNIRNSVNPIGFMGKQTKSVLNMLKENGFEIVDHTNSKYYDGMAINVLLFEEDENIKESIITETIKPTIYYKNKKILNGEVIVSTPINNDN